MQLVTGEGPADRSRISCQEGPRGGPRRRRAGGGRGTNRKRKTDAVCNIYSLTDGPGASAIDSLKK